MNAFGYWQGQDIKNATATYLDDLMQAFVHIQKLAGSLDSIELWNGETGWPTTGLMSASFPPDLVLKFSIGGSDYGSAVASTENAETFFQNGVCAAVAWGFNVFYFEAFDEPWKPTSIGDTGNSGDETHWGAYTADRTAKFSLNC